MQGTGKRKRDLLTRQATAVGSLPDHKYVPAMGWIISQFGKKKAAGKEISENVTFFVTANSCSEKLHDKYGRSSCCALQIRYPIWN